MPAGRDSSSMGQRYEYIKTRMGREKGAPQIGRSRGGPTSKIHAVVDAIGRPMCLAVTEGHRHEMTVAPFLRSLVRDADGP